MTCIFKTLDHALTNIVNIFFEKNQRLFLRNAKLFANGGQATPSPLVKHNYDCLF